VHPSCTMFRQALRLITIAQYMEVAKGSAYDADDCKYLIDYLRHKTEKCDEIDEACLLPELLKASSDLDVAEACTIEYCDLETIDPWQVGDEVEDSASCSVEHYSLRSMENLSPIGPLEGNALYDIMGWAVSKFFRKVNCHVCRSAFAADSVSDENYGTYTAARSCGGLAHPSKDLLAAAKTAEQIFIANKSTVHLQTDVDQSITQQILDVVDSCALSFPKCHNALSTIVKKFVRLRINEYGSSIGANSLTMKRQFGSKTAARITFIP